VLVQNSSNTTITDSQFHTNGYGIYLTTSSFITIEQCTFYHNGIGVYLWDTHCTTITNSYADTNGIGFLSEQSSNIYLTHSAARDNDDNEGGMFFSRCSYIEINNCNLEHNGVGVNLINSSTCYIDHCTFTLNTHFACKLKEALSGIIITNSLFTKNLRYGVHAEKSSLTLSWSNLYNNTLYGLYAPSSSVDAHYNWWGFRTGPARTGLGIADRGTWNHRSITYTPWLTFPMPEVGANWKTDNVFQKPAIITPWPEHIVFPDSDTDSDGAPDWWEEKWGYNPAVPENHTLLDPDGDGLNNIEECYTDAYGSNPFHQDVFLEFDWTVSTKPNVTNKPQNEEISLMIAAFAAHNITLHVDVGNLGGGEEIPAQSFVSYGDIVELYWRYFLHHDLNNPRQRIFHYGLICDYSEGPGFVVVGWDQLSSFVIGAQYLVDNFPYYSRAWLITTASMHETGHTFGLLASTYSGIDNRGTLKIYNKEFLFYIHYKSLMNYLYTWSFMDYSDGSHGRGDFNDWGNLDFSFFKNTHFEYPPT
jgi:parallel beta-helix repeat protein